MPPYAIFTFFENQKQLIPIPAITNDSTVGENIASKNNEFTMSTIPNATQPRGERIEPYALGILIVNLRPALRKNMAKGTTKTMKIRPTNIGGLLMSESLYSIQTTNTLIQIPVNAARTPTNLDKTSFGIFTSFSISKSLCCRHTPENSPFIFTALR